MQIVTLGYNLHELSNYISGKNMKILSIWGLFTFQGDNKH